MFVIYLPHNDFFAVVCYVSPILLYMYTLLYVQIKHRTPLVAFKSNQHDHHHSRYNPLHDDCCSNHHLFSTGSTCCCNFCPLVVIAVVVIVGTPFHRFIPVPIPAATLDDPVVSKSSTWGSMWYNHW